jgi:hypothetical protein
MHERRVVNVEHKQILRGPHAHRIPAHLIDLFLGHPYPSRDALVDVTNDIRMKALAHTLLTDQAPKHPSVRDPREIVATYLFTER